MSEGKSNFAVEVEHAGKYAQPGEVTMRITHNGYQWTAIDLKADERLAVAKALLAYKP